jgi:hypothetical protein
MAAQLHARLGIGEHSRKLVLALLDRDTDQATPIEFQAIEGK